MRLEQERVRRALRSDRRRRSVPAHDLRRVGIDEEFRADLIDDVFQRRSAEVPAADAAAKERVAREERRFTAVIERERGAAGRVAGGMNGAQTQRARPHR